MRIALLVTFAVILFAGCKSDDACDGACAKPDAKYGIADRTVHSVRERTFDGFDGERYTLVRVEFGETAVCDVFDENCTYSVYCGFVVDGEEYPVYGDFVTDADVLFDEDADLTGLDLPIFDDEDFDTWLWDTDVDDDILIACFDE